MKKHILLIFAGFAFCFLASCTNSYYRSPMLASTKTIAVPPHKVLGKAESKDCSILLGFVPILVNSKKMYNDVWDQSKEMGGDAVIDFQVRQTSITNVFFLYILECYSVVGTVVKFSTGSGASAWDAEPSAIEDQKQETKSAWD